MKSFLRLSFRVLLAASSFCHVLAKQDEWTGTIHPKDPYIYVGQTLALYCSIKHPVMSKHDLGSVTFQDPKTGLHWNTTTVNQTTVKLEIPKVTKAEGRLYACKASPGESKPIDVMFVRVDYPPTPPNKLQCQVNNWRSMGCLWNTNIVYNHPEDIRISLKWRPEFSKKEEQSWRIENAPSNVSTYECIRNEKECTWTEQKGNFYVDDVYEIQVSVENLVTGDIKESQTFVVHSQDLVKPKRIRIDNFSVVANGSRCLKVRWKFSGYGHRQYCKILVNWIKDVNDDKCKPYVVQDYLHAKNETELCSHTGRDICGFEPYANYIVGIQCAPCDGGFKSDLTQKCIQMPEDVPQSGPIVTSGGFWERPCGSYCRTVAVYWQPVKESDRGGVITEYRIRYFDMNTTSETSISTLSHQTTVDLNLTRSHSYSVYFCAKTSAGYSEMTSTLNIQPSESLPPLPSGLLSQTNFTRGPNEVTLSWHIDETLPITSYTVYHCVGSFRTKACQDYLHWTRLPANQSSFILHPLSGMRGNTEAADMPYLIGLSQEVSNQSSGITWSKCIYIKGKVPKKPPPGIGFYGEVGSDFIIHWLQYDCDDSGYIQAYNIRFCVLKATHVCAEPFTVVQVDNLLHMSAIMSYNLRDLKPNLQYGITLQAVSDGGEGPGSKMLETPKVVQKVAGGMIGLVACLAAVNILFICLAIWSFIRCVRNCIEADMSIEVPPPGESKETGSTSDKTLLYEEVAGGSIAQMILVEIKEQNGVSEGSFSSDEPLLSNNAKDDKPASGKSKMHQECLRNNVDVPPSKQMKETSPSVSQRNADYSKMSSLSDNENDSCSADSDVTLMYIPHGASATRNNNDGS